MFKEQWRIFVFSFALFFFSIHLCMLYANYGEFALLPLKVFINVNSAHLIYLLYRTDITLIFCGMKVIPMEWMSMDYVARRMEIPR